MTEALMVPALPQCPVHKRSMVLKKRERHQYECPVIDCDVVCHMGTTSTPADLKTRVMRYHAHLVFDKFWVNNDQQGRTRLYQKLAKELGIPDAECHIGMFDAEMCRKVQEIVGRWNHELQGGG